MTTLNIRIDETLKEQAESVFDEVGLSISAAINVFFRQVVRTNSIPFELSANVPNKKTIKAIEEGRKMVSEGQKGYRDIESLKEALK